MGVSTEGGRVGARFEIPGGRRPSEVAISKKKSEYKQKFPDFPDISNIRWAKSERKPDFGGRWL